MNGGLNNVRCITLGLSSQLHLDNVEITKCGGSVTDHGGAINSGVKSKVIIKNSVISYNSAGDQRGGAIAAGKESVLSITDTVMNNNTANNRGGSLYAYESSEVSITN